MDYESEADDATDRADCDSLGAFSGGHGNGRGVFDD
jgi:hypothetical protein